MITTQEPVAKFDRAIMRAPQVLECHATSGDYDYMLKIVAPDMAALPGISQRLPAEDRRGADRQHQLRPEAAEKHDRRCRWMNTSWYQAICDNWLSTHCSICPAHHGPCLPGNFLAVFEQNQRRNAANIELRGNLLFIFRIQLGQAYIRVQAQRPLFQRTAPSFCRGRTTRPRNRPIREFRCSRFCF